MKLKLDVNGHIVVQDGKPVYVKDDGQGVAFDARSAKFSQSMGYGASLSSLTLSPELGANPQVNGKLSFDNAGRLRDQLREANVRIAKVCATAVRDYTETANQLLGSCSRPIHRAGSKS